MSHNSTIFSQILRLIDRRSFNTYVNKYEGNKGMRTLSCWDQFVLMLFGQLNSCTSGRDALTLFNSFNGTLYHLGTKSIAKSTLNDANAKRNSKIFEDLFYKLTATYRKEFNKSEAKEIITAIDSTEILLPPSLKDSFLGKNQKATLKLHTVYCLENEMPEQTILSAGRLNDVVVAKRDIHLKPGRTYVFDRGYYDFGWWHEINACGSFFVTRLKKHTKPKYIKAHSRPTDKHIISDHVIQLNQRMARSRKNPYQKLLRRIIARNEEGKEVQLITNDFASSAKEIADKYRARWKIELFFKWIKQNLKIKKFYGRSPNAIKTQIYIAMIAYILLKRLYERYRIGRTFKDFSRIISRHLLIRNHVWWNPFEVPKRRRKREPDSSKVSLFNWEAAHDQI